MAGPQDLESEGVDDRGDGPSALLLNLSQSLGPGWPPAFSDVAVVSASGGAGGLTLVPGPKYIYTSICLNPVPGHA